MKTASLRIAFAVAAVGLTASAAGLAGDTNSVERFGRDSVTVWNSNFPLMPAAAPKSGPVWVGYGRAGGLQPTAPPERHPKEALQANHVERNGRA